MNGTESGRPCVARLLVALACVGAFLFSMVVAATPGLHERIHHDAGQSQHECAITVVSSGKYQLADSPQILSVPDAAGRPVFLPSLHPVWVAACFASARIFEHAPPALS